MQAITQKKNVLTSAALAAAFCLGAVTVALAPGLSAAQPAAESVPGQVVPSVAPAPVTPAAPVAPAAYGLPDFTKLVEEVSPAVVNIRTTERVTRRSSSGFPRGSMDEDMLEFFRQFGFPVPGLPQNPRGGRSESVPESRVVPRGVGSGFIVSADGYVMTNAHVVAGAEEVIVTLTDKREFQAKVIGADERTDVAVLKIDAENLPTVKIGNVDRLKVGEWVIAIGSPFGLESTVTAGIVSAKQRDTGDYLPFIQTDVAVNPGNSGGPLINLRGEVVGVNSQIYSRSGGFMGISFAIPIDEAVGISDQLKSAGRVVRGRIGVQIGPVSNELAESLGIPKNGGALVSAVEKDSPADKAGLQAGDIITAYNGTSISSVSDLPRLVGSTRPGTKSEMEIYRRGTKQVLTVTVDEMQDKSAKASAFAAEGDSAKASSAERLGLKVQNLSEQQRKELSVRGGVIVNEASGAAAQAGIREGDVVLSIGQTEVLDTDSFKAAVEKVDPKRAISVLVRRGDWAQYVLIRPEK